jgi:hypothetical protein
MGHAKRQGIPAKVKVAIEYLINQKADYAAAAAHAQITTWELRRSMGQPHIRRYALEQRQLALEAFCLGSPAALAKVRDESENAWPWWRASRPASSCGSAPSRRKTAPSSAHRA